MIPVPTIHLNGSSQESLLEDATSTANAIGNSIQKMIEGWPNARDYYTQGPEAYGMAVAWWQERMNTLRQIRGEFEQVAEAISNGGKR